MAAVTPAPPPSGTPPPIPSKKRDWYFIASIITTVVLLYFTLFPLLCGKGVFPPEFLGKRFGITLCLAIGFSSTVISGTITYLKWRNPIETE